MGGWPLLYRRLVIGVLGGAPALFVLWLLWAFWAAAWATPLLAPVLPRPAFVPPDSRATWDFKGGNVTWWSCAQTASGRLVVRRTDGYADLSGAVGAACPADLDAPPSTDMANPEFLVFDGRLFVYVPGQTEGLSEPCPVQLSSTALDRMQALLGEAQRIGLLSPAEKQDVARMAAREIPAIRDHGLAASGYSLMVTCEAARSAAG